MNIQVLGPGCPSCKKLHKNVTDAVGDNKDIAVEYITDMNVLLAHGIMATPALLINDKIVSVGRIPSSDEIKEYIEKYENGDTSVSSGCSCGGNC